MRLLLQLILKYKYTVILFIFYIASAFYIIYHEDNSPLLSVISCIVNALMLIVLGIYLSRLGRWSVLFLIPINILVTGAIVFRFFYSSPINIGAIASVFETNATEALGVGLPMLPAILLVFCVVFLLTFLSVKELRRLKIKLQYLTDAVVLVTVSAIILIPVCITGARKAQFDNFIKKNPVLYLENRLAWRLPLVVAPSLSMSCYFSEMAKFREQLNRKRTLPEYIYLNKEADSNLPKTLFVVIGESSIPDHYSLYGYDVKTTPFLESLLPDKLFYYNAISPAPFTRDALRLTLSFATPDEREPFYENENNVGLANLAGFESYWISNQNIVGLDDSYIGMLASYANTTLFYDYKVDDLDLISKVKELYDPSEKQIFYIHLKGSHMPYIGYDEFDTEALGDKGEFVEYDKTIHHTDRVLKDLYSLLESNEDSNSLIFYYSDHGEVVNQGHGFFISDDVQFRIPFIAIPVGTTFNVDPIIRKYFTNDYFNTVNLNFLLAESMGYRVKDEYVMQARRDGLYVQHVDGITYCFPCTE